MNTAPLSWLAVLAAAFAFGALSWVFFVQAPVLLRALERERFVALQMRLVRPLFRGVALASLVALVATLAAQRRSPHEHFALAAVLAAATALLCALVVAFVVAPRALRAGGSSVRDARRSGGALTVEDFALDGGGAQTRLWHRVLGTLAIAQALALAVFLGLSATATPRGVEPAIATVPQHDSDHGDHGSAVHAHGALRSRETAPRYRADDATRASVLAMQTLTREALASGRASEEVSRSLRARFGEIFAHCTMTGPAHEALHGFLLPVGERLEALERAHDRSQREAALAALDEALARWDARFE